MKPPIKLIIEALIMASDEPLSIKQLMTFLNNEQHQANKQQVETALEQLQLDCNSRGIELVEVARGYRYQTKSAFACWVQQLLTEKPTKYSRAFLEILVLIAYHQPITRGEIEEIRGVTVNSTIIKTLHERDWIKVLGYKEVPGKPALLGTTTEFLDYFKLKSLSDLPSLLDINNLDKLDAQLQQQISLTDTVKHPST